MEERVADAEERAEAMEMGKMEERVGEAEERAAELEAEMEVVRAKCAKLQHDVRVWKRAARRRHEATESAGPPLSARRQKQPENDAPPDVEEEAEDPSAE